VKENKQAKRKTNKKRFQKKKRKKNIEIPLNKSEEARPAVLK